jgi:HPt (histidine-containing phosphotransfer) domain-containing protein
VEHGDAAGLSLAAHSLKSNARDFGATRLYEVCHELEKMGRAGITDRAADKLSAAEVEYARVERELEAARRG